MGGPPSMVGVPPTHPCTDGMFPEINHPAIGDTSSMETHEPFLTILNHLSYKYIDHH